MYAWSIHPVAILHMYIELDHAHTHILMATAHGMGGYPANMPPFDVANYYYHGQAAFMVHSQCTVLSSLVCLTYS